MATPRHRTAPGSSYFVTTKCWQGRAVFQVPEIAEIVVQTLFHYRERNAYQIHEFVVMPNHLHVLLTPAGSISLEKAVQFIKGGSSHAIHKKSEHRMEIWQEGFHDWTVRDADDWRSKVEYIRLNPVRAHLVAKAEEWPYSSASGRFALDPSPARYSQIASGAKAPPLAAETPGLKSRPPENHALATARDLKSRPPENHALATARDLKSRPPENHALATRRDLKSRPAAEPGVSTERPGLKIRLPEGRGA